MFGCMRGLIEGTDVPVTVSFFSHRRQRLIGGWPREGDVVACERLHSSVFEPRTLLLKEELGAWAALRNRLPFDVVEMMVDIRRPLVRVEA